MVKFEDGVIDDSRNDRYIMWAVNDSRRVRCIAYYTFLEDHFGLPNQATLKQNAPRLMRSLQPEFEQLILTGHFVRPPDGITSVEATPRRPVGGPSGSG